MVSVSNMQPGMTLGKLFTLCYQQYNLILCLVQRAVMVYSSPGSEDAREILKKPWIWY